ncbi:MAG TPA: hypothetical protein VMN60_13040 [Longimicrobiales bacterium]|nr:hypothetical protein [Longimicrobiales bacterium]
MRRSSFVLLFLLLVTATSAAAQYSISATAEITEQVTVAPVRVELSASATGVMVRELVPQRSGTRLLERTYVSGGALTPVEQRVWVQDERGLRQEQRSGSVVRESSVIELGAGRVDVRLGAGRTVTVTKVIAANS